MKKNIVTNLFFFSFIFAGKNQLNECDVFVDDRHNLV